MYFIQVATWKFLCLFALITSPHSTPVVQSSPATQQNSGIIFNHVKTIILADRYEFVEFLLPFPQLNAALNENLTLATSTLAEYWNAIPAECPELHGHIIPDTQADLHIRTAHDAYENAQNDLAALRAELASLLDGPPPPAPSYAARDKRFVGLIAAGLAGAGLLTLGQQVLTGCVAGILGPCHEKKHIAQNRHALNQALDRLNEQETKWTALTHNMDEKFYLVASEMSELQKAQSNIVAQQQAFWNATADTIEKISDSVKTMAVCIEYLFTRSQLNQFRNTILARVESILSAIQSFRVALWAYRAALVTAIPGLTNGFLPIALVPRDALIAILERVATHQAHTGEHYTLALSLDKILRYYETPLIRRAETAADGLLLTLAIPLVSREMIMNVYEAIPLPMPDDDSPSATLWSPEDRFLAVTQLRTENAIISAEQLALCIGPKDAAVCQRGFATTRNRDSCLASLFFHGADSALTSCTIRSVPLPRVEHAQSVGHGRWLITRQSPHFTLQLLATTPSASPHATSRIAGCRSCIHTLACGTQLESDNIRIKADATSCNATGAQRLDLELAPPLNRLFSFLPIAPADKNFIARASERQQYFHMVQAQLPMPENHQETTSSDTLHRIAQPIAEQLRMSRPLPLLPEILQRTWYWDLAILILTASIISLLMQCAISRCQQRKLLSRLTRVPRPLQPLHTRSVSTPAAPRNATPLPQLRTPRPTAPPSNQLAVVCASMNQRLTAQRPPTTEQSRL